MKTLPCSRSLSPSVRGAALALSPGHASPQKGSQTEVAFADKPSGFSITRDTHRSSISLAVCLFLGSLAAVADMFVRLPDLPTKASISWLSAWGDYDNDGYPDLVVANGGGSKAETLDLYRNRGDGTFEAMTADRAGEIVRDAAPWMTVWWSDINNDGHLDLIATAYSQGNRQAPRLFLNQGDGSFHSVPAGELTNTKDYYWSMPPADFNGDGWIDQLLSPDSFTSSRSLNRLLLNRGDGTFGLSVEGTVGSDRLLVNGASWADYDNDGDPDLFLANVLDDNNLHRDRLYQNDGQARFTSVTNTPLVQSQGATYHSACGDFDNDGDFDCVVTKSSGVALLFVNDGGSFSRPSITLPAPSGGPSWIDYDNDGYLDLFMDRGQGNVRTNVLLRNLGNGTFVPVADVITTDLHLRQGYSWGDLDNDGYMDLIEGSPIGRSALYHNLGNTNHWLKLRLKGTASNAAGVGATIRVRATLRGQPLWQMQQVGGGGIMQNDLRPNFGLGDATKADEVRIEWPSGNVMTLADVAANQILTITEQVPITPLRPVATINGSASLNQTVTASSRQWYFEGAALADQTNRILVLTNLQPAQAGRYSAVAQTANGPATNSVHLKVNPQFTKILTGEIVTETYGTDAVTWFDYDRDGFLDVLVPHDQKSDADSLFRNNGDGTFTKVLGSPLTPHELASLSGAVADYDNDGDVDVLLARFDKPNAALFRNDGSAGFSRVANTPFSGKSEQGMDAGWADYDGDGDVDLLVVNGYDRSQNDALYRNNGDGTFSAVPAEEAGDLVSERSVTWLCTWVDFDRDGHPDVATLGSGLRLYRNTGTGSFTRVRLGSLSSMSNDWGLAWGDYDNDGFPDLFAGRFGQGNAGLHRNVEGTTFTSISRAGDLMTFGHACLGVWGDYDNDGYLDLFVEGYTEKSALYRNRGDGTFESVDLGNLLSDGAQRDTAVWVDYDNNGFLDLMLACGDVAGFEGFPGQQNQLFRNNGNGNHWLKVRSIGTTSNRDGIGAKVRVTATLGGKVITQLREISGNSGYHGVPLLAHFGLGDAIRATTVHVDWPSGITQEVALVAADQALTLVEPALWKLSARLEADGLHLQCLGAASATAHLQGSSNLKSWSWVADLTTDATGAAAVTLPITGSPVPGFYRIQAP